MLVISYNLYYVIYSTVKNNSKFDTRSIYINSSSYHIDIYDNNILIYYNF